MMKYCKIRPLLWILVISVLWGITGCVDESLVDNKNNIEGSNGFFQISLSVSGLETVVTRTNNENEIENVDVLLFGPSNDDESLIPLLARKKATMYPDNKYLVELPTNPDKEDRHVLVLANAQALLTELLGSGEEFTGNTHSLKSIKEGLITKKLSDIGSGITNEIPDRLIVMSSDTIRMVGGIQKDTKIPNNEETVTVTRVQAKIAVETGLDILDFQLEGATVCDVAQYGYILKQNNMNDIVPRVSYKQSDGNEMVVGAVVNEKKQETLPLYVYETNLDKSSPEPVKVIIKAKYKGESTYYRLDLDTLNALKKPMSLIRNHKYIIQINRVDGSGYDTYEAARENPPSNIGYFVKDEENSNSEIIGKYYFSLDYEEVDIHADSLSSVLLARITTNYPLAADGDLGSITANGGLILQSSPNFLVGQNYMDIIVDVPSSFTNGEVSIRLDAYRKNIKVRKRNSLDIHADSINYQNIKVARILSSSGFTDLTWIGLSVKDYYNPTHHNLFLDEYNLSVSNYNLYIYADENLQRASRQAELSLTDVEGRKKKLYINQEGYERYMLGYFGGTVITGGGISMFSNNLIIEAYEEDDEKRIWTDRTIDAGDKSVLTSENGKAATWLLATKYNSPAAIYCIQKNIDKNINGTIDEEEVEWYLPSIKQGLGISLYELLVDNIRSAYWSSTVLKNNLDQVWSFYTSHNYGLDEITNESGVGGFQISSGQRTKPRYVRCVRDI